MSIALICGLIAAWSPSLMANPRLYQIETRDGIRNRILVFRPANPIAAVVLFPDGSGRLALTHVFNQPGIGNDEDIPTELMAGLLRQNIMIVLPDAPFDHSSHLGLNGWHGRGIFRISADHAQDVREIVAFVRTRENVPVWLAGIRMGAFSATNAAIRLGRAVDGLIIAGGITRCPEQKSLRHLCPEGLMGMDLYDVAIPTLVLSGGNDDPFTGDPYPETMIAAALSGAPTVRARAYPAMADFELWGQLPPGPETLTGISEERVAWEMANFIRGSHAAPPAAPGLTAKTGAPATPMECLFVCLY
jgi:pimeloyl-ACP methyl ester carboxylesterase